MTNEPKRRGRPPVVKPQPIDTQTVDEVFAENPTAPIVEENLVIPLEHSTTILSEDAVNAEASGQTSDGEPTEDDIINKPIETVKEVEGWHNDIHSAPIDGRRIMVSESGTDQGSLVYWRISRIVDKKNLRYIPKGRWTDFLTKKDITFTPNYWKPYNPEEYWPLTV